MVGLLNLPGDPNAVDPVDRESARAQAVVSLYAQSSFEFVPLNADVHRLLDPLIAKKGMKEAIREASPITYVNKDDPPFLEILGDKDEYIPIFGGDESTDGAREGGRAVRHHSHSGRPPWHGWMEQAAGGSGLGA